MREFLADRSQVLALLFWAVALIPAFTELSGVHLLLCLLPLALHRQMRRQAVVRWSVILVVLLIAIAWVPVSGERWLSSTTVISLLALVLLLKWAEASSARELRISALASIILATLSSLYLDSLMALVYLLGCGLLLLVCLQSISDHEQRLSNGRLLKSALNLTLLALPVTVVLFVTVPRIQGPLWDVGLAIGLPIELAIDKDARDIGLKSSLKAGQISRLKRSDAPVLVAEFSGAIPRKSRLYWRGPVFSDYDGTSWSLPKGWNNRSRLLRTAFRGKQAVDEVLTEKRDRVHYEARVSPHSARWLYALDLPTGRTPEAFISADFQLLGIRKIDREFKYDVNAWLEYRGGRPLNADQRLRYLQYPANSNPQLKQFGAQLRAEHGDPEEIIHNLRAHLATGGYNITPTTDIAEHANNLDEFFFQRKTGTIEHLAGSTALLLRAAGIPTRLITGYRGGSLIALTNFVVVKQEHAHVWVEAWSDAKGWQRVEAKDFVSAPKAELPRPAAAKPKAKAVNKTKPAAATQTPAAKPVAAKEAAKKKPTKKDNAKSSSWFDDLSRNFETWVLNYNPERQVELMKKGGLRQVDWKNLAALALLGLFLLALIYASLLQLNRRRRDPVSHSFEQLNQRMAKMQLACGEQECPSQWLQRISQAELPFYPALQQVVTQYLAIRYRTVVQPTQVKQFQTDVKRLIAML